MARLIYGTPEYQTAFGSTPEAPPFTSMMPEYYALKAAWADPSLRANLGLDNTQALNSQLAKDVQVGAKRLTWALAVPGKANIPSMLLDGVRELTFSASLPSLLPDSQLLAVFDPSKRPPGGRGVVGVAVGAAIAAAGVAVPVVGQIAGLLVAIGSAIFGAVQSNDRKRDLAEAKYRELLYKSFPPLQVSDSATDTQIVRRVHAILETDNWTDIFRPRFKGSWVGLERDFGFAFAPGNSTAYSEELGEDIQSFEATGGIGCIPNTGIVTSVLQVSLDPNGSDYKTFQARGWPDPRELKGAAHQVVDTGAFYTATANQASLAFSLLSEDRGVQGNPFLFRLDVKKMADEWEEYFLSGLDYIRSVAVPWWESNRDENSNLEGFFASAVFYAVGAWAKQMAGGTTTHPKYAFYKEPYGIYRNGMTQAGLYRGSERSGAFLPIRGTNLELTAGMGSQWERGPNVKKTCAELRAQQLHDLSHTLVCMYVRRTSAAFADPQLADMLDAKRRILLKRPERKQIVLQDIPEDETLDGKLLRDLAVAAGVPAVPAKGSNDKLAPAPRPKLQPFSGGEVASTLTSERSGYGRVIAAGGVGAMLVGSALAIRHRMRGGR